MGRGEREGGGERMRVIVTSYYGLWMGYTYIQDVCISQWLFVYLLVCLFVWFGFCLLLSVSFFLYFGVCFEVRLLLFCFAVCCCCCFVNVDVCMIALLFVC